MKYTIEEIARVDFLGAVKGVLDDYTKKFSCQESEIFSLHIPKEIDELWDDVNADLINYAKTASSEDLRNLLKQLPYGMMRFRIIEILHDKGEK